jgi:hypothetical protein
VSSIAKVHSGTVLATAVPAGGLDITVRLPRRYAQGRAPRPARAIIRRVGAGGG